MSETVVGWCAHCWAHSGGRKFYIYKGMIYHIPIWDVFTRPGERGEVGERLYGAKLIKFFPN